MALTEEQKQRVRDNSRRHYLANKEKIKERHLKYRFENKERIREQRNAHDRKHYSENKEKVLERNRKWAKANPEKIKVKTKERSHKHYLANKEKLKERHKKYYVENKEKWRGYGKNPLVKRAVQAKDARRRYPGEISTEDVCRLYVDNIKHFGVLTCYLCGGIILDGQDSLDHKIPIRRGGTNEYSNLGVAHLKCNLRKGCSLGKNEGYS
jgi:5-methylcytosine-specific restriction endonuclease McrA